jgi:hypothetical protein
MARLLLLLLSVARLAQGAKTADPKECEVCISNLEAIELLIDKEEKNSKQSITEAISKCGPGAPGGYRRTAPPEAAAASGGGRGRERGRSRGPRAAAAEARPPAGRRPTPFWRA